MFCEASVNWPIWLTHPKKKIDCIENITIFLVSCVFRSNMIIPDKIALINSLKNDLLMGFRAIPKPKKCQQWQCMFFVADHL